MGQFYRLHYNSSLCIKCPTPLHTICIACVHGTSRCSRKSTTTGSLCAQHARVLHKHKQISIVIPIYTSDAQHIPKCKQCNSVASHQYDNEYVCAAHAEYCALCKCVLHHSSYRLDMPLCSACQITKCRHIGCILPNIQGLSYCAAHHPICDDATCGYRAICVIEHQKLCKINRASTIYSGTIFQHSVEKLCIKHAPTCAICSAKIKIRGMQIGQKCYCNKCGVPPCIICSNAAIHEKSKIIIQKSIFVCEYHNTACIYPGCMQSTTFEYCEKHAEKMQQLITCIHHGLQIKHNLQWFNFVSRIIGKHRQITYELCCLMH